jgi:uncharacterized protein YndB with AHSA1/START domain
MELKFQVQIKIQKPVSEVFSAVYEPEKLCGYFTNGGASAPLDAGTTVQWAFEDTPGETIGPFPVEVKQMVRNEGITIEWEAAGGGYNTTVEFQFESTAADETLVKIVESGWRGDEDDLAASYGNCMGWSQMLCALKAYVEYGINLRKGAYAGLYKASDFE